MNHKLSLGLAMLPLVPAVQAQEQGRQEIGRASCRERVSSPV